MASTIMSSKIDSRSHLRRPQLSAEKLSQYLAELSLAEAASSRRNEELLADITKVTKNAQLMKLHTENLKSVRDEYENYYNQGNPLAGPPGQVGQYSTLEETACMENTPMKSDEIFHSTPLHHPQTKKVPPLSSPERVRRNSNKQTYKQDDLMENKGFPSSPTPDRLRKNVTEVSSDWLNDETLLPAERCKRNILDLSSQLKDYGNIPIRSAAVPKGTKLYPQQLSVDLEDEIVDVKDAVPNSGRKKI